MEKKLKIILCIAVIILASIIAFAGVYSKDSGIFKSKLPSYVLGSEFGQKRVSQLVVSNDTKEVIYDKDGNIVDAIPDGAKEEDYRKEQEKENKEEAFTIDNYKKVKEIFEGRLKSLGIEDYVIRVDENTGDTVVELEEGLDTDTTLQYLLCTGDFSITDSKDKTVLLDKSDIKEAKVVYARGTSGVQVYLDIVFDKEGKEKLAEISRTYLKIEDENSNNEENTDDTEEKEDNQKKVTITIEGNSILTTAFGEEMLNGELPLTLGSSTDSSTVQEYANQGRFYAMLINNDTMPLKYNMGVTEAISSSIQGISLYMIIGITLVVLTFVIIYMICRFRLDGLLAGITIISSIALLLIVARYTRIEISLNAIAAISIIIILNAYILCKMLNNIKKDLSYENIKKQTIRVYLENLEVIIVSLILAIIFTFMQYAKVFSFGMTLFYGIISVVISNLLFLRTMLLAKYSK